MFLSIIFLGAWAITYDSGLFQQFDYLISPSYICKNTTYQQKIMFSQAFANPPQIILSLEKTDLSIIEYSLQVMMILNITNVDTTYFELSLKCNLTRIYSVKVRWYAFDDKRIEILNKFTVGNFQSQTFDHMNPYAIAGFISVTSLTYFNSFSFNISISSITPTQVSIYFTDPLSQMGNIVSIGYQIILAPPEQFTILSTVWTNSVWTSPSIDVVPNTFFMIPRFGYEYNTSIIWRVNTTYLSMNPIQYRLDVWDGGAYIPNSHLQIAIQKVDPSTTQQTSVNMLILETNQQFSYGQYSFILDKNISSVNFEITVRCLSTQSVQSSFYIYVSLTGSIQQNLYMHKCSSQYRILSYYARFKQQITEIEQLKIVTTSNSLTVTQINIYNQFNVSQQQLVAIQVI